MARKKQPKITKAVWGDDDKSLVRVFYDNETNEYCSTDSHNSLYQKVLKQFTVEEIEKETEAFKFYYTQREQRFRDFNDNYELWRGFWRGERLRDREGVIDHILKLHEMPQQFFKLKLSIFEMQRVRENKNREWKASLRKAQTGLELLALLYQEIPDLESERVESEDETSPQDTTNQENNPDSIQESNGETSDAPSE